MIFANLRAQRWNTSFYNVTGSRMEELSRQFKAGEINENQLKEAVRELAKGYGKDIGIDFEVVYLDEKTMSKDSKGSTGSSYILDKKNKKVLIPIDVNKIGDINKLFGTLTEEVSHGKDALEGRQDKEVAEDKSNNEKGLESLGRPANDYVKNKLGEDNNSKIKLSTDGIDLTNANVGEKVGDVITSEDRKERARLQAERPINKKIKKAMEEFKNSGRAEQVSSGFIDMIVGGVTATGSFSLMVGTGSVDFATSGSTFVFTLAPKAVGVTGMTTGGSRFWVGTKKVWNGLFGEKVEYQTHPIRDSKLFKGNEEFYDLIEITTGGIVAYFGQVYPTTNTNKENLENAQAKGSKETVKVEQKQGQNPQQGQRSQDNIAQNNKNSINKTQAQESQNNPSNQQVSKGVTSNNQQQGAPDIKDNSGTSQGIAEATQKVVTINNKQNTNPLIKGDGTLNNGTYYVITESSSEKIKSIDELLTKEGQAKIGNSSMEELQNLFEEAGYKTELTDASGSGGGQRLIIQGHNIGSIRSNTSAGTHRSIYRIISGNFKDDNGGSKIKVIEGTPDSYHTRGNTPEKAEIIFVEKKEENN